MQTSGTPQVNLCPICITSCQRSLAFGKIRSAKNAVSPDTIGSGKHCVSFSGSPGSFPVRRGCPAFRLLTCHLRPGPCRIQSRTGRGLLKFMDPGPPEMGGDFLRAGESVIVFGPARAPCSLLGTRAGVMFSLRRRPPASLSRRSGHRYRACWRSCPLPSRFRRHL